MKKIVMLGLLAIGFITGLPPAHADEQCQFIFPIGTTLLVADTATYRYTLSASPFANARLMWGPFLNLPYLAYTDGDSPTQCTLWSYLYDSSADPFYLRAVRPVTSPSALVPFFLNIDTQAHLRASLSRHCILSGICVRYASSAVAAVGAGLPNVYITNYFLVITVWI